MTAPADQPALTRRQLLGAGAAATAAVAGLELTTAPAAAAATFLAPRRVIFGASVTRLAASAPDGLRYQIPFLVVDGLDDASHGGLAYPIDGRGLTTAPAGSLNIEKALADEIKRGVLRPGNANKDWVIIDWTLGNEAVATAAPVVDHIIASCATNGFRLAWVIPHVYYAPLGASDTKQQIWNADARAMLTAKVGAFPGGVLVDWDLLVQANTASLGAGLTQSQKDLGNPLLYDGRHPTGVTANPGRGGLRFGAAIAAATGL